MYITLMSLLFILFIVSLVLLIDFASKHIKLLSRFLSWIESGGYINKQTAKPYNSQSYNSAQNQSHNSDRETAARFRKVK